jgi:hypothetical protein
MSSNRQRCSQDIAIANNGTFTNGVNAGGMASGSFIFHTALTGTAVTFQGSIDNSTWYDLYTSANAAVGVAVIAVDRAYPIPAQVFDWPYFRIVITAQGAARTGKVSMNG